MFNKTISLTSVFLKETIQNLKIFKKAKKNSYNTIIIIVAIAVAFISYRIIDFFNSNNISGMFLILYFQIFNIFLAMQIILYSTNILFFSKNLEYILPLPISSKEIVVAKYLTIVMMTYITELIFTFLPMLIYGLITHVSLLYFLIMPVVLLIFPLFFVTIISTFTIIFMKLFKIIKNKNLYQMIIVSLLMVIVLEIEMFNVKEFINNIDKIEFGNENQNSVEIQNNDNYFEILETSTKNFLVINPTLEMLYRPNKTKDIMINFTKLIIYNVLAFIPFLSVGRKIYLKNVLLQRSIVVGKNKKTKEIKINRKKSIMRCVYF
ncbi:MAG: hypothetical protein HUJ68_09115 [Clostridia bacterium]|nr:hypothetical protein [Clostridia bacterium]